MKDKKKLEKKLEENLKKQKRYWWAWREPPAKLLKQEFQLRMKLEQPFGVRSIVSWTN